MNKQGLSHEFIVCDTAEGVDPLSCTWFERVCPGEPRVGELAAISGGCRWVSQQPDEDCPSEEEWEGFSVES